MVGFWKKSTSTGASLDDEEEAAADCDGFFFFRRFTGNPSCDCISLFDSSLNVDLLSKVSSGQPAGALEILSVRPAKSRSMRSRISDENKLLPARYSVRTGTSSSPANGGRFMVVRSVLFGCGKRKAIRKRQQTTMYNAAQHREDVCPMHKVPTGYSLDPEIS